MPQAKLKYELCKEVYKRKPEWYGDSFGFHYTDLFGEGNYKRMRGANGTSIPEHTSDYLLEKLPRWRSPHVLKLISQGISEDLQWYGGYLDMVFMRIPLSKPF